MASLVHRRLWEFGAIGMLVLVLVGSLLPTAHVPHTVTSDKFNHFITYATLMVYLGQLYPNTLWRVALSLVAMGVMIEYLQPLLSDRHFEWLDMVANAIGVGIGLVLLLTPIKHSIAWIDRMLTVQR